jgi:hypothetical protein
MRRPRARGRRGAGRGAPGDTVLLSPALRLLRPVPHYEERGDHFRALVSVAHRQGASGRVETSSDARRQQPQPSEHRLLLTATFCLLAGGAVMVYSARRARTLLQGEGDGTAYLVKYLIYGAIGLVAMHVLARHGLEHVRRYTPLLLLVAFVLLVLVLSPASASKSTAPAAGSAPGRCSSSPRDDEARARAARGVDHLRPPEDRAQPAAVAGPIIGVGGAAVLLIAASRTSAPRWSSASRSRRCSSRPGCRSAARADRRRRRLPRARVRDPRALPARAADRVPEPLGGRRRHRLPGGPRARSRSAPAACSGSAPASRCRRSSTCRRPTPTSSWP